MGHKMFVTILFLTLLFFVHLNLSSRLSDIYFKNSSTHQPTELFDGEIENFSDPKFKLLSYRLIYPNKTFFREFIAPTLNSKKLISLYYFFYLKNPSISFQNFLPPERFYKSHTVLTKDLEQKIIFNFHFGAETPFSKFKPILYDPTNNILQTINLQDSNTIPDGRLVANLEDYFFPFRPEFNSKSLNDENKTVMIATKTDHKYFFLILEDSTDKNAILYSEICHGEYKEESDKSILFYKSWSENHQRENIEYPKDINLILKAKFMSGIQKYFFQFQYGHIQICQKSNWFCFIETMAKESKDLKNLVKIPLLADFIHNLFIALLWVLPYKAFTAALFSPLYFYSSPHNFWRAFNAVEPLIVPLFWVPTMNYIDLQFSRTLHFQIHPLNEMFAITTFKVSRWHLLKEFFYAWFVLVVFNAVVYYFFAEKLTGEFLE